MLRKALNMRVLSKKSWTDIAIEDPKMSAQITERVRSCLEKCSYAGVSPGAASASRSACACFRGCCVRENSCALGARPVFVEADILKCRPIFNAPSCLGPQTAECHIGFAPYHACNISHNPRSHDAACFPLIKRDGRSGVCAQLPVLKAAKLSDAVGTAAASGDVRQARNNIEVCCRKSYVRCRRG